MIGFPASSSISLVPAGGLHAELEILRQRVQRADERSGKGHDDNAKDNKTADEARLFWRRQWMTF